MLLRSQGVDKIRARALFPAAPFFMHNPLYFIHLVLGGECGRWVPVGRYPLALGSPSFFEICPLSILLEIPPAGQN